LQSLEKSGGGVSGASLQSLTSRLPSTALPSVIHHQRRPAQGHVSIERLFEGIRQHLPPEWQVEVGVSPQPSRGLVGRLRNIKAAAALDADLHHIVGDAHYLALGLPGGKLVLTIHDCAALERLSGWRRELLRQLWFVQPMKRAAVVTTISNTTKDELRRWVGNLADKVVVIPNCVRNEFRPDLKPFDEAVPRVLQVGTKWNKNVTRVAQALVGTPCELDIVGELSEGQRREVAATGVPFQDLGRLSDDGLLAAYRRCDLLVFASLYEGFGLPILEAQALGRPVITSKCSSMPEAAGSGALLVNPESVDSIHTAIQTILKNPIERQALIERGFENVRKFQPDVIAGRYAAIYRQILSSDS